MREKTVPGYYFLKDDKIYHHAIDGTEIELDDKKPIEIDYMDLLRLKWDADKNNELQNLLANCMADMASEFADDLQNNFPKLEISPELKLKLAIYSIFNTLFSFLADVQGYEKAKDLQLHKYY